MLSGSFVASTSSISSSFFSAQLLSDGSAMVSISGEDAAVKAPELSGSDIGGRKIVVQLLSELGKTTVHRRPRHRGPVVAATALVNTTIQEVFKPTEEECAHYLRNPSSRNLLVHVMLLTGCLTDDNGNQLLEFQENGDLSYGHRGFLYFERRIPSLVFELVKLRVQ